MPTREQKPEEGHIEGNLYCCDNCGFAFDKQHAFEDGTFACPVCEVERLKSQIADLTAQPAESADAPADVWAEVVAWLEDKRVKAVAKSKKPAPEYAQHLLTMFSGVYQQLRNEARDKAGDNNVWKRIAPAVSHEPTVTLSLADAMVMYDISVSPVVGDGVSYGQLNDWRKAINRLGAEIARIEKEAQK